MADIATIIKQVSENKELMAQIPRLIRIRQRNCLKKPILMLMKPTSERFRLLFQMESLI